MLGSLLTLCLGVGPIFSGFLPPQATVFHLLPPGQTPPNFTIPRANAFIPPFVSPVIAPTDPNLNLPPIPEPGADVEFSCMIEVKGSHVIPGWLDSFGAWMNAVCKAGLGSLEVGPREGHLHVQCIFRKRMIGVVGKKETDLLRNQMKAAIGVTRGDGSKCQIILKAFAPGQTWGAMLGYCTKDDGKHPNYSMVRLNVTDEAIAAGKLAWASARLSYEDDRLVLNKKNLFQALFTSLCARARPTACASQ